MSTLTIEIKGDKEIIEALNTARKKLSDFTDPLTKASQSYLNVISMNFKDQGATFGKTWTPIATSTIEIKKKLKKEGKAIAYTVPLVRTGKMRKSFEFNIDNLFQSTIGNSTAYAQFHQEGGTVNFKGAERKVPKRILAAIDDKRVEMVNKIFDKYIDKAIDSIMK